MNNTFENFVASPTCLNNCCWESSSSISDGDQFEGVNWPETSIKSVQKCAELCEMNVRCDGFHYYGSSDDYFGDCYLKTNVTSVSKDLDDGRERYGGICRKGISIVYSIGFERIHIKFSLSFMIGNYR